MQQPWAPEGLVVGTLLPPGPSRGPHVRGRRPGWAREHAPTLMPALLCPASQGEVQRHFAE